MTLVLVDAAGVIERECIEQRLNQRSIALTYALAMRSEGLGYPVDWKRINAAIRTRWPKGVDRIKKLAWKLREMQP